MNHKSPYPSKEQKNRQAAHKKQSPKRPKSKETRNDVRKSNRSRTHRKSVPRTASQYQAKPEKFKDMWERVVTVVSKMRSEKASLQKAAQESGISPNTVKRWAGSALQKRPNGKWVAKKRDTLLRVLMIPTPKGPEEIAVRGSGQATQLAEYWNAVHKYLQTGNTSGLKKFRGKSIKDANGAQVLLPTQPAVLNRLGSAGVLSFESLYARSA